MDKRLDERAQLNVTVFNIFPGAATAPGHPGTRGRGLGVLDAGFALLHTTY